MKDSCRYVWNLAMGRIDICGSSRHFDWLHPFPGSSKDCDADALSLAMLMRYCYACRTECE